MKCFIIATAAGFAVLIGMIQASSAQSTGKINPDAAALVHGNNEFALNLYQRLAKEQGGNLFLSPYSISTALAMTYGGAAGQTATEMKDSLKFPFADQRVHAAYADLVRELNQSGQQRKYQLSIANRLWGRKGLAYVPDFLKLTRDSYGAGLQELDFAATEEARKNINDWIAKETQGKIRDLLAQGTIDSDTALVLTNAIYFKAQWAHAFQQASTNKEDFKVDAKEKIQVDMMHVTESNNYLETDALQLVELPYEQRELSMFILLPRKVDGLADLQKEVSAKNLDQWIGKLSKANVNLSMPKFTFTSEFKLKDALSQMGMSTAFSDNADFSNITSQGKLQLANVIHKAFVAVDEKGTEAAAATAVVVQPTAAPVQKEVTMRVDHPFMFVIRDNRTGSIMFVGRVARP